MGIRPRPTSSFKENFLSAALTVFSMGSTTPRHRPGFMRRRSINSCRAGATPQTGALADSTVNSRGITPRRGSAMLEFNTSEFGRFRLQYNLDYSRGTPDNQGFLQYIVSLGAHGAHSY